MTLPLKKEIDSISWIGRAEWSLLLRSGSWMTTSRLTETGR